MHCGKNVFSKDFAFDRIDFIIEAEKIKKLKNWKNQKTKKLKSREKLILGNKK